MWLAVLARNHSYNEEAIRNDSKMNFFVEDVLFNSILARAAWAMSELATKLGMPEKALFWSARHNATLNALSGMWSPQDGIYLDITCPIAAVRNCSKLQERIVGGLMPLFATGPKGLAETLPAAHKNALIATLQSKAFCGAVGATEGGCMYGVPSYETTAHDFNPRLYWRGPSWINTNWLLWVGLNDNGFTEDASRIETAVRQFVTLNSNGFHEYFNPITADPHGTGQFSWSAALFIDMFYSPGGGSRVGVAEPSVVHSWGSVEFLWDANHSRTEYLATGGFVPEHCVITGLKVWEGDIYVTVPRWRTGVPSTMNKVVFSDGRAVLDPFPSWEWNDVGNPAALRYTQSMEIDINGVMWILDVGRLNIFSEDTADVVNGIPKLILWDISNSTMVHTYLFTDTVAPYSSSFLNDLVLDRDGTHAYISDAATGGGALVVYDRVANRARRFVGTSTRAEPGFTLEINGFLYNESTPVDGIAISPDWKTIFYSVMAANALYGVPAGVLSNFSNTDAVIDKHVIAIGPKPSSDGMTTDSDGRLYFGDNPRTALGGWDTSESFSEWQVIFTNNETMQWVDTFAFSGSDLMWTTNKLQSFFNSRPPLHANVSNFRIWRLPVGSKGYISGQERNRPGSLPPATSCLAEDGVRVDGDRCVRDCKDTRKRRTVDTCEACGTPPEKSGLTAGESAGIAVGVLVMGVAIGILLHRWRKVQVAKAKSVKNPYRGVCDDADATNA